ncbi:hypothetical protein OsI_17110 [Oryza sativa Indica Group]|uniref:Threonylcarbamoyl-AMP synthase n=1 Tax=Oryza sativa subsp. indica TaxID=39946 RepID=B8ATB7_ORYSI|nr:hypothetical protein OsI_17110 [Oryza sativa Indica Group]
MAAAAAQGMDYLTGVEISVTFIGTTVHIVGLGFDPDDAQLVQGLSDTRGGRGQRAQEMAQQLAQTGVCRDTSEVFRRFLTEGKPGYVPHRWAALGDAVRWITQAGGMAVIAHPARYKFSATQEYALFSEFRQHGGQGVEVVTGSHTAAEYGTYAAMAQEFGLAASRGSDFHSPDESHTDLGTLPPLPGALTPVWDLLADRYFEVHPDNPQPRLLKQAAALLARGAVLAVPTDSSYALVCQLDDKDAVDRLRRIRQVDEKHHLTLLCRDLSEVSNYARVDNRQYRLVKQATPGPYTFILDATKEVPRRVSHPQRKTIGLRVPDRKGLQLLLELHGAPLLATTLIPPGETEPMNDPSEIRARFEHQIDAVVDAGACPLEPTTVVDLTDMATGGDPRVVREGRGPLSALGL